MLGSGGLLGTKGLLAGHPLSEQLGNSVGGALAHFLAGPGSSLLEKSASRFQLGFSDWRLGVPHRRCGRHLANPRFEVTAARRDSAIRRRAKPEASSKGASHPLSKRQSDGVLPRANRRGQHGIERDAEDLDVGHTKQGDYPGGEHFRFHHVDVVEVHRRCPIRTSKLEGPGDLEEGVSPQVPDQNGLVGVGIADFPQDISSRDRDVRAGVDE
jgi:hypothetical protein